MPVACRSSAVVALCVLGACTTSSGNVLPSGSDSYRTFSASTEGARPDYRIEPLDTLSIVTFGEPELTFKEIQVDSSGNLRFPLIGTFAVAGLSPAQLTQLITTRLNTRFLRNAEVTVLVASSAAQRITIEGSVQEPGVYELRGGSTTLLEALARAKSPTRTADLSEIAVFRVVDGERLGARFDLTAIRQGRAPDPLLRGGDVVVVGHSGLKAAFRDFLAAAPLFNVFVRY